MTLKLANGMVVEGTPAELAGFIPVAPVAVAAVERPVYAPGRSKKLDELLALSGETLKRMSIEISGALPDRRRFLLGFLKLADDGKNGRMLKEYDPAFLATIHPACFKEACRRSVEGVGRNTTALALMQVYNKTALATLIKDGPTAI